MFFDFFLFVCFFIKYLCLFDIIFEIICFNSLLMCLFYIVNYMSMFDFKLRMDYKNIFWYCCGFNVLDMMRI